PSTWEQMFQELIQEEKPRAKWTLQLDKNILPNVMAPGWRQYQRTGLGKFQCSICNRWWISAQVKVLCHVYREPGKSQGQVLMRIFGQRCQKCSRSRFENPEFFTESIRRILENLINYILQRYYGHGFKKKPSTSNEKPLEKVLLDRPHDTANCEACSLGYYRGCAFAYDAKPPKSPSSQPKSQNSSQPKSQSSSQPKSQSSSQPKSQSSSQPKSQSSSQPKSQSSSLPKSQSSSQPKSQSSSQPKNQSSSQPKSQSSSQPKSQSSFQPKSQSSSQPKSQSSSQPKSQSSSQPKSYGSSVKMSQNFPPKTSYCSSVKMSQSCSSPPKSYSSLPQTRNTYFANRHFVEPREPRDTGLLVSISLIVLTFICQFFK
ncbi:hypothetical protein STEG23_036399, partial [Scotinomys teguina]